MKYSSEINNESEGANNADFIIEVDTQERIAQIDIRIQNTPHRDSEQEPPRYEVFQASLEETINLRDTLNRAIREMVGL